MFIAAKLVEVKQNVYSSDRRDSSSTESFRALVWREERRQTVLFVSYSRSGIRGGEAGEQERVGEYAERRVR